MTRLVAVLILIGVLFACLLEGAVILDTADLVDVPRQVVLWLALVSVFLCIAGILVVAAVVCCEALRST